MATVWLALAPILTLTAEATAAGGHPAAADQPPPAARDGGAAGEAALDDDAVWAATTAGEVVPHGRLQLEAGFVYQDRAPGREWGTATPLNLRLGVAPRLETAFEWDGWVAFRDDEETTRQSPGDTRARLKLLAVKETGWLPSVAPSVSAKAPTASERRGAGSGEWDFGARLDATRYWIEDVFYTEATIDFTWLGEGGGRSREFLYQQGASFLAGYDGLAPATLYGGIFWATEEERGGNDSLVLSLGWFYFPRRRLAFDLGVDLGLAEPDAEWGVYASLIWMAPRLWGGNDRPLGGPREGSSRPPPAPPGS